MSKIKEFREKLKKKTKLEMLKSMFQSMAITVTAVVAVIVLVPKSPVALIDEIQAFTNEIIYHVDVTDEDNAIIPGTLKVVLENQFEYYETSVDLGKSAGIFTELTPNTQYNLQVMADKGFGLENLASSKIVTVTRVGGGIISSTLISPVEEFQLNYEIMLFFSDPDSEFKTVQIHYGTLSAYQTEVTNYLTIPLLLTDTTVMIPDIYNENLKIFLILEGIRWNDEIVELDTFEFMTPFQLDASLEVSQIDSRQFSVMVFPDMEIQTDTEYQLVLKRNKQIIETRVINTDSETYMQYEITEVFKNLSPEVEYTLELVGTYVHPYWLTTETEVLVSRMISTLPDFDSMISIAEFETHYEVSITLTDPFHNFQLGYFTIYQVEAEYEFYFEGSQFDFISSGEQKTTTFIIDKPLLENFRIEVGVRSATIYYQYSILKEIKPNN